MHKIPFGCGFKIVLIGTPDSLFQITSIESSPLSAVTSHFLSFEQAVAVI
jgi:hypothetical protein